MMRELKKVFTLKSKSSFRIYNSPSHYFDFLHEQKTITVNGEDNSRRQVINEPGYREQAL
jgi:hypothetical protein